MQKRRTLQQCFGVALIGLALGAGVDSSRAQSAPVPDHAALIGVPMSARQVQAARTMSTTVESVEQRIRAAGITRTAAQRHASQGLNRELARLPETFEQALAQARTSLGGAVITQASRQEIEPMYAVPAPGGGVNASHADADAVTR